MRNVATMAATLLALVAPIWAQQNGKDESEPSSRPGSPDALEVRAYLLNKDRETVNIVGITSTLVIEGKDGTDLEIPLQVVTTKTGEKNALQSSRPPRELEGTAYFVSLITVPPGGSRRSEKSDADRRLAKESSQEPHGKQQSSPAESGRSCFTLEGPYFKADLTREQLGAFTCGASVRFTIKGTTHTAKGFTCALSKGDAPPRATCGRLADECALLERHLKANEMDKAGVVVDRMSASLCKPCGEAACHHAQHGCASCCKDLRAAISSGNREKALEALDALTSQCSICSPPKAESKTDGERK